MLHNRSNPSCIGEKPGR